jgi:light-regulated signal transduction histidine kinase (bacteriophytochrome)
MGDQPYSRQVVVNLLSNAFKFTRQKEHPVVEVGCEQQGGESVHFVRDNGAGFDMRYADRLFGVFQRLHRAGEFEGTGVGCPLCSVSSNVTGANLGDCRGLVRAPRSSSRLGTVHKFGIVHPTQLRSLMEPSAL